MASSTSGPRRGHQARCRAPGRPGDGTTDQAPRERDEAAVAVTGRRTDASRGWCASHLRRTARGARKRRAGECRRAGRVRRAVRQPDSRDRTEGRRVGIRWRHPGAERLRSATPGGRSSCRRRWLALRRRVSGAESPKPTAGTARRKVPAGRDSVDTAIDLQDDGPSRVPGVGSAERPVPAAPTPTTPRCPARGSADERRRPPSHPSEQGRVAVGSAQRAHGRPRHADATGGSARASRTAMG